jgi:hypothetical protein
MSSTEPQRQQEAQRQQVPAAPVNPHLQQLLDDNYMVDTIPDGNSMTTPAARAEEDDADDEAATGIKRKRATAAPRKRRARRASHSAVGQEVVEGGMYTSFQL